MAQFRRRDQDGRLVARQLRAGSIECRHRNIYPFDQFRFTGGVGLQTLQHCFYRRQFCHALHEQDLLRRRLDGKEAGSRFNFRAFAEFALLQKPFDTRSKVDGLHHLDTADILELRCHTAFCDTGHDNARPLLRQSGVTLSRYNVIPKNYATFVISRFHMVEAHLPEIDL